MVSLYNFSILNGSDNGFVTLAINKLLDFAHRLICLFTFFLKTEADPVFEALCSFEYQTMN